MWTCNSVKGLWGSRDGRSKCNKICDKIDFRESGKWMARGLWGYPSHTSLGICRAEQCRSERACRTWSAGALPHWLKGDPCAAGTKGTRGKLTFPRRNTSLIGKTSLHKMGTHWGPWIFTHTQKKAALNLFNNLNSTQAPEIYTMKSAHDTGW